MHFLSRMLLILAALSISVAYCGKFDSFPPEILHQISVCTSNEALGRLSVTNQKCEASCQSQIKERRPLWELQQKENLVNLLKDIFVNAQLVMVGFRRAVRSMGHLIAWKEVSHYLGGFDGRLSYIMGSILRDEDVEKFLSEGVVDFMARLKRYRAVIRPQQPPHRRLFDIQGDPIRFDAFIKLRDDNMKVIEDQLHGLGKYEEIRREKALLMTDAIGMSVAYPGLREMRDYQSGGFVLKSTVKLGAKIKKILSGELDMDDVASDFLFDTGREDVNAQLNQNVQDFVELVQDKQRYYEMKRRTRTLCGDLRGNDPKWNGLTEHTMPLLEHVLYHGERLKIENNWLKVDNKRMNRLEAENQMLKEELQRLENTRGLLADLRGNRRR